MAGALKRTSTATLMALALTAASEATAHAPPEATGIYWQDDGATDGASARVLIRTNRGLIVFSQNRRGAAALLCNDAWQASLSETPAILPTLDSVLVSSYSGGLLAAAFDLCSFDAVQLPLAGRYVVDLLGGADTYFALTSAAEDGHAILFASGDRGRSWQPRNDGLAFATALRRAPSRPERLYVSQQELTGTDQSLNQLAVSDDGGATFSTHPIELLGSEVRPFVLGVDPRDPARVFVRTLAADPALPERLLLSEDAGETFREVASALGPLTVALGSTYTFLGSQNGVLRSGDRGVTFAPLRDAPGRVACIEERAGELFVCGYAHDDFAVFSSPDQGVTFNPYLKFSDVAQAVSCDPQGVVAQTCAAGVADWIAEQVPQKTANSTGQGPSGGDETRPAPVQRTNGCTSAREGTTASREPLLLVTLVLAARWTRARRSRQRRAVPSP